MCRSLTSRLVGRLAGASALRELNLHGHSQEAGGADLERLPTSLTRLALSTGDTPARQLAGIARLPALEKLELYGAWNLDDAVVGQLATLPNLTHLSLDCAPELTPSSVEHLAAANRLELLHLERCRALRGAAYEALAACASLWSLSLEQVPLEHQALDRVARIVGLTDLAIRDPRRPLSMTDLRALAPLSNLRRLMLEARRWSLPLQEAETVLSSLFPDIQASVSSWD